MPGVLKPYVKGEVLVGVTPTLAKSSSSITIDDDGNVVISGLALGSTTITGNFIVDGNADEPQLVAQAHSTQTNPVFVCEQSDGTDVFTVSNAGCVFVGTAVTGGASAAADDLVISQTSGNTGMTIKLSDSNLAYFVSQNASGDRSWITMKPNEEKIEIVPDASTVAISMTAGNVNMPNQPSFLAANSVTDSNVTGNGTVATVEFDTEVFDQGGDYNNSTDTFTAPVTGKYQFNVNLLTEGHTGSGTSGNVKLVTSNATYIFGTTDLPAGSLPFQVSIIADMDASDTATVTLDVTGEGADVVDVQGGGSSYTNFSGFLAT